MRDKPSFTDKFVRSAEPGIYFDHDHRSPAGFVLRVTAAGAKSWCLNYRLKDTGRERRITIGSVSAWPIAEARKRGAELRRIVDAGGDPLADREEKRAAPTVAALVERFGREILPGRAVRSQEEYRSMFAGYILPALGRRKVVDVSLDDVERLHRQITESGKPSRANRVKSLVSTIFSQAIRWHLCERNPAAGVKGNREHHRERYLSPDEIERLMAVLDRRREAGRHVDSADAIGLLLLTGARRGEVLGMRWADLDLGTAVWTKPPGMTKQRQGHRVPLSDDAVAVLQRRQAEREAGNVVRLRDDGFVFRGGGTKTHCNRTEEHWQQIRAAAGIEDVRLHDLRHSFASVLIGEGLSLEIIGGLLGHHSSSTTRRYAHLADSPMRAAAERVAAIVRGPAK
jgi:integrase